MNNFRTIIAVTLILFGLSSSTIVFAQSSDTTLLPSRGEHIFTSITDVEDPFISTKFNLNLGIANLFNTEIPVTIPVENKTVNFQPQLFYVVGGIEFQKSINDWATIHLNAGATARIGNDVVSIATQGISAANFFGIGLMFCLAENKNLFLSGSIDLNKSSLTYISLQGKFEDFVSDTSLNQKVFNQYQILTGQLQLRFAYNFSSVIGIMANGNLESIEINRSSGKKILDEAAIKIVKLAGQNGFAPFPPNISRDTDILHITRTWVFTRSDELMSK